MQGSCVYSKCYYHLFNAVTAQIEDLEALNALSGEDEDELSKIITALKPAQCEAEELFISETCD